jgi:transcription elongation GreA/GreB family factor
MDKIEILRAIAEKLAADLEQATDAAIESAESATHEESRSEGKYDTRGLETSYLASGQARHAIELRESLAAIKNFSPPNFTQSSPIALGALVTLLSSQGRDVYFLAPGMGGMEIPCDDSSTMTVISSRSPIGNELIGKRVGDRIQAGGGKTIIRIA